MTSITLPIQILLEGYGWYILSNPSPHYPTTSFVLAAIIIIGNALGIWATIKGMIRRGND